jgi:hypothetical protein
VCVCVIEYDTYAVQHILGRNNSVWACLVMNQVYPKIVFEAIYMM